ncbi:C-GCAxxG-C-C family protein [Lepagella muris]|uniref:C_GCAxxG_C_C family protein n=1 Tax=Lepagella muris TaxID=3032870 RepID=A0AC61RG55_9BACT|nr:C-GCAxxG-C-C family protein [Lepagella muris]TGY78719.1 C_GCAxxG_C_C family protein [Lepagella muris]THG52174.1 C_GCAxxG_C_C family protein [Bacteroidales bacterium]TKC55251.1 C_GCAxxG_C_C family protein [Bacteroidales bacterium]
MKNKLIIPVAGLLAVSFCSVAANAAENKGEISEKTIDMKMENKLIKKATEIITKLREDGYSCSQATFLGICQALGSELTEKQLKALSAGFRGGIGKTYENGTCGALSAGVMALGLYTPDDNDKGIALAGELFKHFKDTYGTVKCGDIVGQYQFTRCTGCCLCIAEKAVELLQRENIDLPLPDSITWNEAVQSKPQKS